MRLLIKIGSACISTGDLIDYTWLRGKVKEIASLCRNGSEVIIVSSGAVAAGMEIKNLSMRPNNTLQLQLLAGMGQIRLMKYYKDFFKDEGIYIAQVLLTHHNFATPQEEDTIREIMNTYLQEGTVPIINENDLVNKEELDYKRKFSDNDILAALVAVRLRVDLAVILTDVDGLYRGDPKTVSDAALIEKVDRLDEQVKSMASRKTNTLGLGGMDSKVKAAEIVTQSGIDLIVANGKYPLLSILQNKVKRTFFSGCATGSSS